MYAEIPKIKELVEAATKIVIIQADNPDGDSLASSLALEQILGDLGKEPYMYCGVDIPSYLSYLSGWDRVSTELPPNFDLSIIVDTSAESLLEQLGKTGQLAWVKSKPCIVLDHHQTDQTVPFATVSCNQAAVATGEVIYEIAADLDWPLSHEACSMLATSIMADSRGLTTDKTTARSIHIIAELVDKGVSIPELEVARRAMMKRPAELVHYKGVLLQRSEYLLDDKLAIITIPWEEIEKYSHAYNPTMLVIEDMLLAEKTEVVIGFKVYPDGRITAKIRANYGSPVAGDLAAAFGGGGHPYASGFKVQDGTTFTELKAKVIAKVQELLENNQNS